MTEFSGMSSLHMIQGYFHLSKLHSTKAQCVRVNAKSDGRRRGDAGVSSSSGGEKEERV